MKNRVAVALRTAATTRLKSDNYLGARYRNLRRQLPSFAAAVKALGRYLAVLIYRLLTQGEAWVDRGVTRFERRGTEQEPASLNFKARAKGFKLFLDHRSQLNENHIPVSASGSFCKVRLNGAKRPGPSIEARNVATTGAVYAATSSAEGSFVGAPAPNLSRFFGQEFAAA